MSSKKTRNDFDMPKSNYHDIYRGFVIHHDSSLTHFLYLLYFIGALGSTIVISYQAAFKNFDLMMFCISYAFDGIYIAKMIVSFYVASVDEDGTIVGDWGDIVAKYVHKRGLNNELKSRFVKFLYSYHSRYFGHFRGFTFDLMTIFPFEVIAKNY